MQRKILGFHQDDERHWVVELSCGHTQHVRHNPPFFNREWVVQKKTRESQIGQLFDCKWCDMTPEEYKAAKIN